jgi:hypothetical protein
MQRHRAISKLAREDDVVSEVEADALRVGREDGVRAEVVVSSEGLGAAEVEAWRRVDHAAPAHALCAARWRRHDRLGSTATCDRHNQHQADAPHGASVAMRSDAIAVLSGPAHARPMSEPLSPRDEMNDLLNAAVEVASELLESNGEFDPFALALQGDGKVIHLEAENVEEEAEAETLVENLRQTLRERLPELRAIAVVADVTVEDEEAEAMTAAVSIQMEHINSDPIDCFVPYEINGDELEMADLVGEPGTRHVFPAQEVN